MPHFHPCLSAVHSDSRSWLSPLRGLVWIYGQRVVTVVILADLDETWRPCEEVFRLGDFESRLRFPVCKLIDWMMSLPEDLSRRFEEDLVALEESSNMPYVTSVERIAEARGETKCGVSVLLGQLMLAYAAVPEDVEQRLYRLPLERLAGSLSFSINSICWPPRICWRPTFNLTGTARVSDLDRRAEFRHHQSAG